VRALDRKLARDLWSLKTQVLSIALVIACGIGGFIGSLSTHASLLWSRGHYYDTARFPHVFASAKRAPASLVEKIRSIPGVVEAETRVVSDAQLSLEGVAAPMTARLIGIDFAHPPGMNRLTLSAGRWPAAGARGEAVVNQRFFEARGLSLGSQVRVLMNGRVERLAIVGTALTPEYVYATRGGGMPDDEWFAILWIDAAELAAACDMAGAFNSALLRLERGASTAGAIAALDRILEPYGGLGAVGREDQVSDKILKGQVNLGGESKRVTILFSDIRNFTGMSEAMQPQQVVAFLNDYFSEMVDAVFELRGVPLKREGSHTVEVWANDQYLAGRRFLVSKAEGLT